MKIEKKYKLILEYPGSPTLGYITSNEKLHYCKNYPQFWEEIIEEKEIIQKELFKDYNGNDIFINDSFYCVSKCFKYFYHVDKAKYKPNEIWITFKTLEDKNHFIILNKPCLSLNDISSIYVTSNIYNSKNEVNDFQSKLIYDLAKSKLINLLK